MPVEVGVLDATAAALLAAAGDVSAGTRSSYGRRWRQWEAFAAHHGVDAFPASPDHVEAFVVARHAAGVSASGIAANLSAISWFHCRGTGVGDVTSGARVVLKAIERLVPSPPVRPAPVLSVGALLAMAGASPGSGLKFAARVVRAGLPTVKPRQLLLTTVEDVEFATDGSWAELELRATPSARAHPALPAGVVRVDADPGWVACPVRALRQLVAAGAGRNGMVFTAALLALEGLAGFDPLRSRDGVPARQQVRDSAVVCVGYGGALRNEDLARARVEHLEPFSGGFLLRLPDSKTARSDQVAVLWQRDDGLDPVSAIHRWLAVRGDHDGPLFIGLHHRAPGRVAEGDHLPSGSIAEIVRDLAVRAGVGVSVSGYSLRRSWATHRYLTDRDDVAAISVQLRHASLDMTVRYIEDLRVGLIEPDVLLSPTAVTATPGGPTEQRKDIGFSDDDLDVLLARAAALRMPAAATARGTQQSRDVHLAAWRSFTTEHRLEALPATPETVGFFAASRADQGLVPRYLRAHLATIRRQHLDAGFDIDGLTDLAEEVIDAYARSTAVRGVRRAPILSIADLLAMARHTMSGTRIGRRSDVARRSAREHLVLAIGYGGAMRVDDLRRARLEDIEPAPWGLLIRLRASKDNQAGDNAESVVVLGRDDELDPVAALRRYHDATSLEAGPLIASAFDDGAAPASYDAIVGRLRDVAAAAGVGVVPGGHSLRRSWATHAAGRGVDMVTIQRHLRHTNITDTAAYIDALNPWHNNPATDLGEHTAGQMIADRLTR